MSELSDTASLLALMELDRVGPAGALAAARAGRWPVDDPQAIERAHDGARSRLERCVELGVTVVSYFEAQFPAALRSIPAPPAVLYLKGSPKALQAPLMAVVGTREPSSFGLSAADAVIAAAAGHGVGVVSGLAFGIDARAHEQGLSHEVANVAVLGCGLDRIHPGEHRPLAERIIAAGGALISEQPPGVRVSAPALVARNRLQSGLALAVVVCQSRLRGGTMHTARFALAQERPLYCPAPISEHPASEGLRALLELPGRELPERLPAFKGARRLCDALGERPAAMPLRRAELDAWAASLRG